ncbi:cytochrome c3 family protein [Geoanaerobacter pelophilus]|nr:cytochrome c3 family protein [Geoanaerobacter pelophilus]
MGRGMGVRRGVLLLACLAACGCDPVARQKALVTVLPGWPTFPAVEEVCRDHAERESAARREKEAVALDASNAPAKRSEHLPFAEKRCNDCHNSNQGAGSASEEGLLVKPREELCFGCHKDLLDRPFHHGPAAVGDCLACHLPHDSANPALLVLSKEKLCAKCHTERRRAQRMHDRFVEKGLNCIGCHDPHSGSTTYFLK